MSRGRTWAVRLHWWGMLLLGLLALLLLTFCLARAQETKETETKKPWTGKLANGREITKTELNHILQANYLWARSGGKEGRQANLNGAKLSYADLRGAYLGFANMIGVKLDGANLSGAYLGKANLSKAVFNDANLSGADLYEADLSGARLIEANLSGASLLKANLTGANLGGANLSQVDLPGANLSGAYLSFANLNKAHLSRANLSGSDLTEANLSGASLLEANLSGAKLFWANLSGAYLGKANLSPARLDKANLSGAYLFGANLSGAHMDGAKLSGVFFEPKPGTVSDVSLLLNIKGLSSLRYGDSSHGLVELREAFKKAGIREPEREVTFALNHTRREKLWKKGGFLNKLESLFHLVCFEWTCDYGMTPGRPLKIIGLGLLFFSLPYMLALRSRNRETAIWLVLPPDRILGQGAKARPFKLTSRTPFRPLPPGRWPRLMARLRRGLRRMRLAFFFSLLSAFNLGWREFNVGNWISRLQKHEYTLRATGWPRTVAGLQSLLSVYLLALWVLTYFGRPFD